MYLIDVEMYQLVVFIDIDFFSFVGLFVKLQVINDVGLFDFDLFIYGDDIFFCFRFCWGGYQIIVVL